MTGLWARIRRPGSFGRAVVTVSAGTVVGQGSLLLVAPLLTRAYDPSHFGVFAVYSAWVAIVGPVGALRYEIGIPLARNDASASSLLRACVAISLIVSAASAAAWLVFEAFPGAISHEIAEGVAAWMILFGVLFTSVLQVLVHWRLRKLDYTRISASRGLQGVATGATQVATGYLGLIPGGLILGQLVGQFLGLGFLAQGLRRSVAPSSSRQDLAVVAREYSHLPKSMAPATLLNGAGLQLPSLLLAWTFGLEAAGLFVLAQRVLSVPSRLVGHSVAQVFLGEASRLSREGKSLGQLYAVTVKRLLVLGLPVLLLLGLLAPFLSEPLFGDAWRDVGWLVLLLVPGALGQFLFAAVSQTLVVLERQNIQLLWDATRVAVVLVSVIIPFWAGASLVVTVGVFSFLGLFSYMLLGALSWWVIRHDGRGVESDEGGD